MKKEQFLKDLGRRLKRLKSGERRRQLEYFDEMITDMTEAGTDEAEAVRKIGSPADIARKILEQTPGENLRQMDVPGILLCAASMICLAVVIFWNVRGVSFSVGGSDGPTSVFLAGKVGCPTALYVITAVVVAATGVYYMRKRWIRK